MGTDFAAVGRLLSVPARSAILDALLDGRELPAGELAQVAGVATSTTSEHLQTLMEGGLVRRRKSGRHRSTALLMSALPRRWNSLASFVPTCRFVR